MLGDPLLMRLDGRSAALDGTSDFGDHPPSTPSYKSQGTGKASDITGVFQSLIQISRVFLKLHFLA